ncbi:MAG TPA: endonuclease MutS2 [Acholeplasmataceae bacterium]|jgi:DNA mismatch repair protein MutS2|nr:endonuclease MutS2 [Acholeplasmataceae bacterium]
MYDYLKTLELDQILSQLSGYAVLERTKMMIRDLRPINDVDIINTLLDEVDEAVRIILRFYSVPIMFGQDLLVPLKQAAKGATLSPLELYDIILLFDTIKACEKLQNSLLKEKMQTPHFNEHLESLVIDYDLDSLIKKAIAPNGDILDTASPELLNIRNKIKSLERNIKNKIQEILAKEAGKLSQATVSIRNDRYVLPVKAEYKNSFKGVVHDTSASLLTVYIEPHAIYELNNTLNKVKEEEKEEINRVLRLLSKRAGNISDTLINNYMSIVDLDFIFAKASYAIIIKASRPKINTNHQLDLINAYHPLLNVPKVIPNSISFGEKERGIIITGPNTGGKTVLLKTVGLLVLMVKCGLLVPCDENSNVMIYDMVCADIGDEQSIQNNLSTFSSHMKNIVNILETVTPNSLVLFDELGSGTDPKEGSSLAMAILKYLLEHKISFITTTHYSELKAFAYNHPEVINASVEFDETTLQPTYKLLLGVPGSSNAFSIAKRLGLKPEIVEAAAATTYQSNDELQILINKLERKARDLEKRLIQVEAEKNKYKVLNEELGNELLNIDRVRDEIIEKANQEAKKLIEKLTFEANRILEEARQLVKEKDLKLHQVIDLKHQVNVLHDEKITKENNNEISGPIEVNDPVYHNQFGQYGVVTKKFKNNTFEILLGNVRIKVKEKDLKKVAETPKVEKKQAKSTISVSKTSKSVKLSLDLRGERYEDAKILLDRYLDDCQLHNIKQATIIHGYGTGVIRELVQKTLKASRYVESFRYGGAGEGGSGATVVTFK